MSFEHKSIHGEASNARYSIQSIGNRAIISIFLQKPFYLLDSRVVYALHACNICQYVCLIRQRYGHFSVDLRIVSVIHGFCSPHLSGLRSNYSSEINQFYKSKIQSHAPCLDGYVCVCACARCSSLSLCLMLK